MTMVEPLFTLRPTFLADNVQIRKISAVLDQEGNLGNWNRVTSYKALCQDDSEEIIHGISKDVLTDQAQIKNSVFLTYDVVSFNYKEDYSKRLPVIYESLKLSVNNYAQVTGKRIFINPDILTRSSEKMSEEKNRLFDVELIDEFKHIDSIQITIPAGYEVESKSSDLELTSKFGRYRQKTVVSADKVMYYRIREQFSGRFPAKDYAEMVKFVNDIFDADHTSIVLVKKN